MKTPFAVFDPNEVIVLHRAVIEAKLPLLSHDRDLSASSILATISERLTGALQHIPQWEDESWRSLSPRHAAWEPAVNRALSDQDYLRKATQEQKREYVRLLLAPYRNDVAEISKFLDHVENILHERRWYQLWLRKGAPFAGGVAFLMEGPDSRYTAWDANHKEIASGSLDEVGEILLEGDFEPLGYFVYDTTQAAAVHAPPPSPPSPK